MLWIAIVLLILGLCGVTILRRHLHEAKLVRIREMAHKERMLAMERDRPVSTADAGRIDSLLGAGREADIGPEWMNDTSVHWMRTAALAVGLTLLLGGAGMIPGLYLQADQQTSDIWPTGLIPISIGVGLLIFVRLSGGLTEEMKGRQDER